jgi:putative ABC transport system substrate-binding protein
MRRRQFITLLGTAAVPSLRPLAARAQQATLPVVGFLDAGAPEPSASYVAAFRKGLSEAGFVEDRNVVIDYRWAHNDVGRLPELAADLVRRRVAVICAPTSTSAAIAAKAATTTIPIVIGIGADPVETGLVASLNRPGGNVTGMTNMVGELGPKQLGILHQLNPTAARYAALLQPNTPVTEERVRNLQAAAAAIGRPIEILYAETGREIDLAFETLAQKQAEALVVTASPSLLFNNRRVQLATTAVRYGIPVIYPSRAYAEAGGLMSYGADTADSYRQVGLYAGRVLKGEKPADLPIMRATKFEFIINLQTARLLRIEVPPTLLAIADEVIE